MTARVRWLGIVLVCLAGLGVVPATTPAAAAGCPQGRGDPVPRALQGRPVVLVHGWSSQAKAMTPFAAELRERTGSRFDYLRFDYSRDTAGWPLGPPVSTCLARYMVEAGRASLAGGGDGAVLAAGHSMGGIAIRAAANETVDGVRVGDMLAGVVTLGTPHQGSPWGGTGPARALEVAFTRIAGGGPYIPPAESDAAACLAIVTRRPVSCGVIPYLPPGVPLTEIGTQIYVKRTLFKFGFVEGPSATIALFGDGVVPADSATGYIGSGPLVGGSRKLPYRTDVDPRIFDCTYTTDYLATRVGARAGVTPVGSVIGGLIGTLGNEALDMQALDRLADGESSPALAELSAYAATTPCFHLSLTSDPRVLDETARALEKYDRARRTLSNDGSNSRGWVVGPGRLGPLVVGMTPDQALQTGYFERTPDASCGVRYQLRWDDSDLGEGNPGGWVGTEFRLGGDDNLDGVIIQNPTFRTAEGLGVGSTLGELETAYGERLVTATYDAVLEVWVADVPALFGPEGALAFDFLPGSDVVTGMQLFEARPGDTLFNNFIGC